MEDNIKTCSSTVINVKECKERKNAYAIKRDTIRDKVERHIAKREKRKKKKSSHRWCYMDSTLEF